jgi:glyoxylase-like metal-dependent hydrolase (beta-lactamase superfamily II)
MSPGQIDTVYLTNFRPANRGAIGLFAKAKLLMHELEQQYARQELERLIDEAPPEDEDRKHYQAELALLQKFEAAEDKLATGVDLFPLFGHTPGTCGLLVSTPATSILIAGDAVPTQDHFLAGQVLPDAHDIAAAQESMREVYEIADLIVPGHDNVFLNPRTQGL